MFASWNSKQAQEPHSQGNSREVDALRAQLNRVDPANRSVAFRNFVDQDVGRRAECIDKVLSELRDLGRVMNIETVMTGRAGARSPTSVTIVEFGSRHDRENALKALSAKVLKDSTGASLKVTPAKTMAQQERNGKLLFAKRLVGDAAGEGKNVAIDWGEREIKVDGVPAFRQDRQGSSGTFLPPFGDLRF